LASGDDELSYDKYYSAVPPDEIEEVRLYAQRDTEPSTGCSSGLPEWQDEVSQAPEFKAAFNDQSQIHFLACVVGLGSVGEEFTDGIAELLLPPGQNDWVVTSLSFGLGDWSIPQGMGFWDMQSVAQVNHDNALYAKDKTDAEIAQKGTIRVSRYGNQGWQSTEIGDQDVMRLQPQTGDQLQPPPAGPTALP
jgi:hypothetical protein